MSTSMGQRRALFGGGPGHSTSSTPTPSSVLLSTPSTSYGPPRAFSRPPTGDDRRRWAGVALASLFSLALIWAFAVLIRQRTSSELLHIQNPFKSSHTSTLPIATHEGLSVSTESPPPPPQAAAKRMRIAVAVTVTRDGPYLDGAAVLQHSVRMTNSAHDVEMVAIVHSDVKTTRPALERLGFKILEFPPPILSSEIRGEELRKTIDKSGCCGALELLKLCAWRLTQYDRVLAMDMDAVLLRNVDHLFETELPPGGLMFTYDYAMDNPGSTAPPVQGGFILVRPSDRVFQNLVEVVREGDFRPGTGWGGTNIGWCWGGQTVQGLLSYFVNVVDETRTLGTPLDPCLYNAMVSTPNCAKLTTFRDVFSTHYTVCQKPWECRRGANPLCASFLHAWWMIRQDMERAQGLSPRGRCCGSGADASICPERRYKEVQHETMRALPMTDRAKPVPSGSIVALPAKLPSHFD